MYRRKLVHLQGAISTAVGLPLPPSANGASNKRGAYAKHAAKAVMFHPEDSTYLCPGIHDIFLGYMNQAGRGGLLCGVRCAELASMKRFLFNGHQDPPVGWQPEGFRWEHDGRKNTPFRTPNLLCELAHAGAGDIASKCRGMAQGSTRKEACRNY